MLAAHHNPHINPLTCSMSWWTWEHWAYVYVVRSTYNLFILPLLTCKIVTNHRRKEGLRNWWIFYTIFLSKQELSWPDRIHFLPKYA
jgi:hypothetical protein